MGAKQVKKASGKAGKRRLVAVVVTHNRPDQLRHTITELCRDCPDALQAILVVDNASGEETRAYLADQAGPDLQVVASSANLGGAGGFALGLREAVARFDPDWLVVMDDDARPAPGALAAFHQADLSDWQAVAAAVYYPDGRICEINRPARNPFRSLPTLARFLLTGREGAHLGEAAFSAPPQPVDWSSFVGLFLSRAALAQVGGPDPRLFLYSDDVHYTLDLTEAGLRLGFLPEIRFEHDCSSLADGSARRLTPLWKTYYYHRNQILLYRRLAGRLFWPLIPFFLLKWGLKLRHHKGAGRAFLKLYLWAVKDGLTRNFDRSREQIFAAGKGR
ncbi:MAG: glycosyltransferase [Maritimibacter sp.]